jgi:hypothetical protein
MNTRTDPPSSRPPTRPWLWATLAMLAITGLLVGAQHEPATPVQAAAPAPAATSVAAGQPGASGAFIDHSVVDRDDLLPSPDPSPMSVAAYGN